MKVLWGISLFALVSLVPQTVLAGTASLTGLGQVTAAPELVKLHVTVSSECFNSASEVAKANDLVAGNVLALLKQYVAKEGADEATASGGYVERHTAYHPQTGVVLCLNKFKKTNHLTLKVHAVETFPQAFAELQDKLYAMGLPAPGDSLAAPTTYLLISTPQPSLTKATQTKLEREALQLALVDATEKFRVTMATAGIKAFTVQNYSENGMMPMPMPGDARSSREGAPLPVVDFGDLTISKWLTVQFGYQGADLTVF